MAKEVHESCEHEPHKQDEKPSLRHSLFFVGIKLEKLNFWVIVEDQHPDSCPRCCCCGWTSNTSSPNESSQSEQTSLFLTICRCRLLLSRASRKVYEPTSQLLKSLYGLGGFVLHYLLGIHVYSANSKSYSMCQKYNSSFWPVHSI